jgi:hypothetical protein
MGRKEKPPHKVYQFPRTRIKKMMAVYKVYRPAENVPRSAVSSV